MLIGQSESSYLLVYLQGPIQSKGCVSGGVAGRPKSGVRKSTQDSHKGRRNPTSGTGTEGTAST